MNKQLKILLRRDWLLLKQKYWKRFMIYLLLIVVVHIMWYVSSGNVSMRENIIGISQREFLNNPLYLPYTWFLFYFGVVLILYDFVTEDLFSSFTNSIIKVDRTDFWISKMIMGIIAAAILGCSNLTVQMMTRYMLGYKQVNGIIPVTELLQADLLNVLSMVALLAFYSFLVLSISEILAFIVCFSSVVIGFPSESMIFPMNHMMYERTSLFQGSIYCIILSVAAIVAGSYYIKKIDLLKQEERNGN